MHVSLGKLTDSMTVVDIIEEEDASMCVRVKLPERGGAHFHTQPPLLKDVHHGKPSGRAEAGAAVVHDAVGSDVFPCHLVHAAAAEKHDDEEEGHTAGSKSESISVWKRFNRVQIINDSKKDVLQ